MKTKKWPGKDVGWEIALVLLFLLITGCAKNTGGGFAPPPLPVEVAIVTSGTVADRFEAVGTLEALDAITVVSAGHPQIQLFQEFPAYVPGATLTSGGYSSMGFTIPAAIGAKLAEPHRQVVGIAGDGDFLMTVQELAVAVEHNIPVVYTVLNNSGWVSIRDFQRGMFGEDRAMSVDFVHEDTGAEYRVDFQKIGEAFGCYSERIEHPRDIHGALERAFGSGRPAVLEVMVTRSPQYSGGINNGHWDLPKPTYLESAEEPATAG